jgi:hypothetical protein
MNRPKTHRWLWWYVPVFLGGSFVRGIWDVFSAAVKGAESAAFIIVSIGVLALEGLLLYGMLFRKKWGWRLNFFWLAVQPIVYIQFIEGKKLGYATSDYLLASALIFVLIFVLPHWIYFKKRKYLFDDGKGPHKMLFRGCRVLDSQESGVEKKSDSPDVVSGSNERANVPKEEDSVSMNDDAFYDQVAEEIETGNLVRGVWVRAFSEADGDENRAKAIYIKLRVTKLSANYRQQKEVTQSEGAISQETSEEDRQAKAFAQWQSEEKDLSPRVDMDGKSELFKAQFELKDQGCKDNSSVISTMIWIVVSIVILAVIVTLTMPE